LSILKGVEALAEVACGLPVRHAFPPVFLIAAAAGRVPERRPRSLEFGEHAAHVRMLDAALKQAARLHHLVAGIVNRGQPCDRRCGSTKLVGVLRRARKVLRDLDAPEHWF
jgi:hypothetical protein